MMPNVKISSHFELLLCTYVRKLKMFMLQQGSKGEIRLQWVDIIIRVLPN